MGRRRLDADIDDEVADHLAQAIDYYLARGLSPDAARREALLRFGGLDAAKEDLRDVRRSRLLDDFWHDVVYGWRALRRAPAFAFAALATLGLGIGANTAVFTVVNGVLLRPMPFADPDRLLAISYAPTSGPLAIGPSLLDVHLEPFRATDTLFAAIAVSSASVFSATLTGVGDPVLLRRYTVTPNYFDVLGVVPAVGRAFNADEAVPGRDRVAVISMAVWHARFGSDPGILDRSVQIDGLDYRIVGIAPAQFSFPEHADLWTPADFRPVPNRVQMLRVIGRLKPTATSAQATAEIRAFAQSQRTVDDDSADHDRIARVAPVADLVVANSRWSLGVFAGAVACVLLIACANVANLLLVRADGRTRELALRAAIGASRARLVRQMLTESTLLSAAGGAAGLAVAVFVVRVLVPLVPGGILPRTSMIHIDGWVLAFTAATSLVTGLAFGVIPALRASRLATTRVVNLGSRGATGAGERLRGALGIAEIGLALVLVSGAGLLVKSFVRLQSIDPGFEVTHRAAIDVTLPKRSYPSAERIHGFQRDVLDRLSATVGVQSVAAVNERPLGSGFTMGGFVLADGRPMPHDWIVTMVCVSENYFRTMGIPIVAGREFTARDGEGADKVVVISASVARTWWPGGGALGQRISMADVPKATDWLTIVGVAADVHQRSLAKAADAATYQPLAQVALPAFINHVTFVLRSADGAATIGPAVHAAVHAVDPNLPLAPVAAMPNLVAATTGTPRFQTWLLTGFAGLALALAGIGVSGVLACSVSLRTREIGIRRALGAPTSQVVGLVLRRTFELAGAGISLGLVGAWMITRVLSSVLFDVAPHDPGAFIGASVGLLATALMAAAVPVWRARSIDPVVAFRAD